MKLMLSLFPWRGLLAAGMLLSAVCPQVMAQQDATLVTGGTLYDSPQGGRWAYLFWRTEDPSAFSGFGALGDVRFAVYAKAGQPGSNAPYAKVAETVRQPNTGKVAELLARAVNVGQNLTRLNAEIDVIFQPLIPPEATGPGAELLLADKVGVLLASAETDEEVAESLFFMGRAHPAIDLLRGASVAVAAPAVETTYEVRLVAADGVEQGVVGRVTLNGAAPAPRLPAPGRPVNVPVKAEEKTENLGSIPSATVNAERQVILNRTLDRVARLRWGTPEALMRVAALQHGFNVYRVERAYAEAESQQWHQTPPDPDVLRQRADLSLIPQVRRANPLSPVLPDEELTPAQAADVNADDRYFFVDDRRTDEGEVEPYEHGSQFYYFVCARDVLGRDGLVSEGTLVTMVNRLPPDSVVGVRVTNDFTWSPTHGSQQRLKVSWEPEPPIRPQGELRYHVFRWPTAEAYQAFLSRLDVAYLDDARQFGRITPPEGLSFLPGQPHFFLDDTPDAPNEDTPRRTYWYTVVPVETVVLDALEGGGSFDNVGPHSAPTHGIIRKFQGPEVLDADLLVDCYAPELALTGIEIYTVPVLEQREGFVQLSLECNRAAPAGIDWVEFVVAGESLGRSRFELGALKVRRSFSVTENELIDLLAEHDGPGGLITVRVGSDAGEGVASTRLIVTSQAILNRLNSFKDKTKGIEVVTGATMVMNRVPASAMCNGGVALPADPVTGVPSVVDGFVMVDDSTPEWRVYRSIDGGPLVLVASGAHKEPGESAVSWIGRKTDVEGVLTPDPSAPADEGDLIEWPANGGRICFYVQTLDVDGNGGPLKQICIGMPPRGVGSGTAQAHRPVIAMVESVGVGTEEDPAKLRIRWVAATGATRRFHLLINDGSGRPPESYSVPGLGANLVEEGIEDQAGRGRAGVYAILADRARVGPVVGAGGAAAMPAAANAADAAAVVEDTFELELPVRATRKYRITVQAVGAATSRTVDGDWREWGVIESSDPVEASWENPTPPVFPQPAVMPWLARGAETGDLDPQVWAKYLDEPGFQGVGIRIGRIRVAESGMYIGDGKPGYDVPLQYVKDHVDPSGFVFRHTEAGQRYSIFARPLSPFVLYRYRYPEGAEENAVLARGSDIVQVSPLIEEVAIEQTDGVAEGNITVIRDPFVRLVPVDVEGTKLDVYLVDTHPVIEGERYRYVLVRFDKTREIEKAYPVRSVDANLETVSAVEIPEL